MEKIFDVLKTFFELNVPTTKDLMVGQYLVDILMTSIIAYIVIFVVRHTVHQFFKRTSFIEEKREQTIESVLKNTSSYILFIVILIAVLNPFLESFQKFFVAGTIAFTIIGFGAQKVINDLLSGIFMIFEQTIRKGDFVNINGEPEGGTIEEVGFRITKIRLFNGKLVTVPNGEIRKVVNGSVDRRRIYEAVVVSFRENPSKIKALLEEVCNELNEKHSEYLKLDTTSEDGYKEKYNLYGLSSLDASPNGFKFIINATVNDTDYLVAAQETKELIAQKLYDNNVRFGEQQMFYQTRANVR